jgi:hypothetical protein
VHALHASGAFAPTRVFKNDAGHDLTHALLSLYSPLTTTASENGINTDLAAVPSPVAKQEKVMGKPIDGVELPWLRAKEVANHKRVGGKPINAPDIVDALMIDFGQTQSARYLAKSRIEPISLFK